MPMFGAVVAVADEALAGFGVNGVEGAHRKPAARGDVDGDDPHVRSLGEVEAVSICTRLGSSE